MAMKYEISKHVLYPNTLQITSNWEFDQSAIDSIKTVSGVERVHQGRYEHAVQYAKMFDLVHLAEQIKETIAFCYPKASGHVDLA